MEMNIVAESRWGMKGYDAVIALNGLVIWTDKEVFNNHIQAELIANQKLLDTVKKLFNDIEENS